MYKNAEVGSFILFGTYEQDGNISNGKEPIEWRVLAKEDNRILVISQYALDYKRYNTTYSENLTWETCTLRQWLNNDFLKAAFSNKEQAMIPIVPVSADKNPYYSTTPGNTTQDRVFLLSIPEAEEYFPFSWDKQCKPTAHAEKVGASPNNSDFCNWVLRTPGVSQPCVVFISKKGDVYEDGQGGNYHFFIRPVLWIDITQ